ncbi:MAG: phenylalanine--tRNA ligase alpha subunit [Bacteroidia bacterium]|nr:MAG: phenylalanine--tRNA ligase alpha subunit [Bacteroidia bacterium]
MKDKIANYLVELQNEQIADKQSLEQFRLKWLSKKGIVQVLMDEFKNITDISVKKELGKHINELKQKAQLFFDEKRKELDNQIDIKVEDDLTLELNLVEQGSLHPLTIVRKQIIDIFSKIGFVVSDGPEIEDDWHNFTALNTPPDHPARDMQDTFYIENTTDDITESPKMLRTQTSSVQIRVMENAEPPIRIICPGRVYRNETISARAHCQFHQVEGLYVDEDVSFADLKSTLLYFVKEMFGKDTQLRMRPSYFPFTEPSAEVDISCTICGGKGCPVCKHTGWVEILGCGMVDPKVLDNCGISSRKYTGFAFGMGIERITMLKYRINDLRLFFENDVRFLKQFKDERLVSF